MASIRTRALAGLCVALLLAPRAAFAGGMPQLDFANPLLLSQVVWGAVIFLALFVTLNTFALPKVGAVLAKRAAAIAEDLDNAHAAKHAADTAHLAAVSARHAAMVDSQSALLAATDHAKREAAAQAQALNQALDNQVQLAEARIATAHATAQNGISLVATETAAALINKLTGRHANEQLLANVVGQAMQQRGISA